MGAVPKASLDDLMGIVKPRCAQCRRPVEEFKVGRVVERQGFGGQSTDAYVLQAKCHGQEAQLMLDPQFNTPDFIERLQLFQPSDAVRLAAEQRARPALGDVQLKADQMDLFWCARCQKPCPNLRVGSDRVGVVVSCHGEEREIPIANLQEVREGRKLVCFVSIEEEIARAQARLDMIERTRERKLRRLEKQNPKAVVVPVAPVRRFDFDDEEEP